MLFNITTALREGVVGWDTFTQGSPPRRTAADFTLGYFRILPTGESHSFKNS